MAFGDKLKQKISDETMTFRQATVMNSYYGFNGVGMFADVIITDAGGTGEQRVKIPILKVGGLSPSLPPLGSTVVMGTLDNNENKPFILGHFESNVSMSFVEDHKRPRKPPLGMTR